MWLNLDFLNFLFFIIVSILNNKYKFYLLLGSNTDRKKYKKSCINILAIVLYGKFLYSKIIQFKSRSN